MRADDVYSILLKRIKSIESGNDGGAGDGTDGSAVEFSGIYAFHINGQESDPTTMVTYLEDAQGMAPAYMDYSSNTFNYGSWKDAFFMPKPCMLNYEGLVDYYLDPDDYTKKEDGTNSDVRNTAYEGNAMMEWGSKGIIWYKVVPDENDNTSGTVYIANEQKDSAYKRWSFISNSGSNIEKFYTAIYRGSVVDNKIRSMSTGNFYTDKSHQIEMDFSSANNSEKNIWGLETFADYQLIVFLLILMAKTVDIQKAYGEGYTSAASSNYIGSGTMNAKGLFWGDNKGYYGVKVFGMENFWGNIPRRVSGWIMDKGRHKVKMTYCTLDGSVANKYNTTGVGYLEPEEGTLSGASGCYIKSMRFYPCGFMLPVLVNAAASSSTYYCDSINYDPTQLWCPLIGGSKFDSKGAGAFYLYVAANAVCSFISCKP